MSASATPRRTRFVSVLPRRLSDHTRSLLLLNEAARTINSILDLEQLLDKIVNEVAAAFDCTLSGIALLDPDSGDLVTAAAQGGVEPNGVHYRVGVDGIIGHVAATGKMHYAPDVRKDPYYKMCTPKTRSEVDIPLKIGDELIGVFSAQHANLNAFSPEHIRVLQVLAEHIAIAVQNARLFQRERAEKQHLYWEQQEAAAIQKALFPKASPLISGLEVEGCCLTARAVGGDWFDYIPLANGRWAFVLADVAGKGMAAALLMTSSRGILRSLAETTPEPAALLTRLNRILNSDLPPEKFVTMLYAVYDPAEHSIAFANAGHPWPVLADDDGPRFLKEASGLPLGITDCTYYQVTVQLHERARVIFYTDGITEAENENREEFGAERVRELAARTEVSADSIIDAMCSFAHCRPLVDDATLIVLKRKA